MTMKKWFYLSGVVVALMLITILLARTVSSTSPRSRTAYRPYDFAHDQWLSGFTKAYADARATQANWITAPRAVALRVAGYPNEDGVEPDTVTLFHDDLARVTVIIGKEGLHDDSVAAKEIRVDLIKEGQWWEVTWAGGRWRCGRDVLSGLWWTTSLCP